MRRAFVCGLVIAAAGVPFPSANADRAVSPTDTLSVGTVELQSGLDLLSRRFHLQDPTERLEGSASTTVGSLAVRGWLARGVWVQAGQRFAVDRRLEIGGVAQAVPQRELLELDLELGALMSTSRYRIGASFGVSTPVNGSRVDAILGGRGGVSVGDRGEAFATARSILRSGDDAGDRGNTFELGGGYHHRLGRISLIASGSIARSLADAGLSSEGFWIASAQIGGVVEVADSLTASLELGQSLVNDHAINAVERSGVSETRVTAGLTYAWDLRGVNFGRTRHLEPSAIAVESVRVEGRHDASEWARALAHAVPALRLATLAAERAAGAPGGVIEVNAVVDDEGRIVRADVADGLDAPALAIAVREFFHRRIVFDRGRSSEVTFSVRFRPSSVSRR
jgi:hypothetical protein